MKIFAQVKSECAKMTWKKLLFPLKSSSKSFLKHFQTNGPIKHFCPGQVKSEDRVRQNDIEKIMAYQKIFIGPLVWKCSTNDFELLLSEN